MPWHLHNGSNAHDLVEFVQYPGLKSSPYHELAKKYMPNGFGGILNFGLKGRQGKSKCVMDNMKLISHLANVGDAKTLAIHPASTTHEQLAAEEQICAGVEPNLVRISAGIEHIEDIKARSGAGVSKSICRPDCY